MYSYFTKKYIYHVLYCTCIILTICFSLSVPLQLVYDLTSGGKGREREREGGREGKGGREGERERERDRRGRERE